MRVQSDAATLPANCSLSARGYGTRIVNVDRLSHGLAIKASDDHSRLGLAFYPRKVSSSSFGLTIIFTDYDEFESFGLWIETYCRKMADPATVGIGPVRVTLPARHFDKVGVPSGVVMTYGDIFDAVIYTVELNFDGTNSPVEYTSPLLSVFRRSKVQWEENQFFYPSGDQEGGPASDLPLGAVAGGIGGGGGGARPPKAL